MNKDLKRFSEIVGFIYEAGLDSDKWPFVLQALCKEVGADKAQMLYLDPQEYMISFACGYGFDPYAHNIDARRFRRYLFDDPVTQYGTTHLDEIFSDRRVIDPGILHASGMQREIRRPANMEYILSAVLTDGSLDWSGFCFFRTAEQEPFSSKEEQILNSYAEHLKRSTYIHKSMVGTANINNLQNTILDDLDTGIIVVDDLHDVVICNKNAQQTIETSGVLRLNNSRLSCRYPHENALLHESIDEALGREPHLSTKRRIAVRLRGADPLQTILAVTTRLQIQGLEEKRQNLPMIKAHYTARIPSRKNALITLCDPQKYKKHPVEMLEHLFGLTPAEAALADSLADDCSLENAAQQLGRAVGTARVQLQSIFEKTDTKRQSSLIRLLMSIP